MTYMNLKTEFFASQIQVQPSNHIENFLEVLMRVIIGQILYNNGTGLPDKKVVSLYFEEVENDRDNEKEDKNRIVTCKSSLSFSVKGCFRLTFFPSLLTTFRKN